MGTDNPHLEPTDLELARRARGGDTAAFHDLVDRHARFLMAVAHSLSGNAADAEDMVQETFAGAFRSLAAFEGRASVRTWLARILIRQTARHFRTTRKHEAGRTTLDAAAGSEARTLPPTSAGAKLDVTAALQALSPDHREIIVLRELQGFSYEEIADALGLPQGTVESRLFRARRQLQELLKDYLP